MKKILYGVLFLVLATSLSGQSKDSLVKASTLLGTPYKPGGQDPSGFDCSGFIFYLYSDEIPNLPRVSRDMAQMGTAVAKGEWLPGDLLFYATGTNPSQITHVALWYGENQLIHSISGGPETGVVMTPADSNYWSKRYLMARRLGDGSVDPGPVSEQPESASPWDEFDGTLPSDYAAWREADQKAFEDYQRKNG